MNEKKAYGPHIQRTYTYRELPIGAISIGIHSDMIKTGSWRTFRPAFVTKAPPCNDTCPAGVDIRGFISYMKQGLYEDAYSLYIEENPFPSICGRVCYHPCEEACNRKDLDNPVEINGLERFLADFSISFKQIRARSGKKVAIIGSGPAGLSSAYFLKSLGHEVTVFESQGVIGGLLRTGIPSFRLPVEIVEKEVERLRALGINFKTDYLINKENWKDVERFDSILLAHGAWKHLASPFVSGDSKKQKIMPGLEFLKAVKMGKDVSLGQKVIVIGGGNTAIDAARVSMQLGASPTIVYRRNRSEMPAFGSEIEDAIEEGVEINYLTSPIGLEDTESSLKLKCVKNRLDALDESGRPFPVPIEDSEFIIEADNVISATGEISDLSFLPDRIESIGDAVKVNEIGLTSESNIFACGDVTGQPRSVAHAIGSGKKAAMAIDCYLAGRSNEDLIDALKATERTTASFKRYKEGETLYTPLQSVHFEDLNPEYFQYEEPHKRPKLSKEARKDFREIHGNLSIDEVLGESERCFSCGMCTHCENCYILCPDGSVVMKEDDILNSFDYEYCKGCGICANECPVGIIEMERE